jgi:small subunit ribosomal protein S17
MAEQGPANAPEDASVSDEDEETPDVISSSGVTTPSGADEAETVGPSEETPSSEETGAPAPQPAKAAAPVQAAAPTKAAAKATAQPAVTKAPRPSKTAAGAEPARTTRRKVREGTVVSSGMEKTAVVVVIERVRHPRYAKTVQRTKRLYAHDETNDVRVGDRVRLVETRPLSKLKRWRVERVLERAR